LDKAKAWLKVFIKNQTAKPKIVKYIGQASPRPLLFSPNFNGGSNLIYPPFSGEYNNILSPQRIFSAE